MDTFAIVILISQINTIDGDLLSIQRTNVVAMQQIKERKQREWIHYMTLRSVSLADVSDVSKEWNNFNYAKTEIDFFLAFIIEYVIGH